MNETPVSLEEVTQGFAEAIANERTGFWSAAKWAAVALETQTGRAAHAKMVNALANVGHCTGAYVRQLSALFLAYPVEYQYPDVSLPMFRAVLQAAKRTQRKAHELLDECLAKGWNVAQVAALGRSVKARAVQCAKTCEECGYDVTVKARGKLAGKLVGLPLPCPICAAMARRDGTPGSVAVFGALGVPTGATA